MELHGFYDTDLASELLRRGYGMDTTLKKVLKTAQKIEEDTKEAYGDD